MNPAVYRGSGLALGMIAAVIGTAEVLHEFQKQPLDTYYWSEGANFGDLNRDGHPDAISGPYWWEGPDFVRRHEIYPPRTTFVLKKADGTEETLPGFEGARGRKNAYSNDNFFTFVYDFNRDGWNDVLTYGLPGTPAFVYLNPKRGTGHWERHQVFDAVDNESPTFADLTGDGLPEIVCNFGGNFGFASPDWTRATAARWVFTPISGNGKWGNFTHGLGLGDVNGDGRPDLLEKGGWWEQPARAEAGQAWTRHPAMFSPGGGAQMHVYDVNGDGRNDVITSIAAHGYGLGWYEQLAEKDAEGHPQFRAHVFMNKEPSENRYGVAFSQLHAVEVVDVDGDGLKDVVTGKCFWAHGPTGDPDPGAPAVLYWFRLVRGPEGVDWVPHRIDADSGVGRQIGVADIDGDGLPEFIIGNKKGTFVFRHTVRTVSAEEWKRAQPEVKFAAAGDRQLKPEEVIQRTGAPK